MPFSWFGGGGSGSGGGSSALSHSAPGRVTRKVSLTNSSSKSGSLAEVRAKAKSSYIRKEMAQSGELSNSRGKSRSTHARPARKQAIVAVEPDPDQSRHRRLDQGLLDASREMQNNVLEPPNKSWWFSSSAAQAPIPTPPPQPANSNLASKLASEGASGAPPGVGGHRRTVSYTYKTR